MRNRWVGYPIQANVWRLPEDEVAAIVADLATLAPPQPGAPPARNFLQWLQAGFGKALTKSFMAPYNFKARRAAAPRGSRAASCRCHLGALTLPCTRRPVPPASPLPPSARRCGRTRPSSSTPTGWASAWPPSSLARSSPT